MNPTKTMGLMPLPQTHMCVKQNLACDAWAFPEPWKAALDGKESHLVS